MKQGENSSIAAGENIWFDLNYIKDISCFYNVKLCITLATMP